jgi:hypothetical protein
VQLGKRENRESDQSLSNFLHHGAGQQAPGNPNSQRNSRGSNEFHPRIITNNSKMSVDYPQTNSGEGGNSFLKNSRTSFPDFLPNSNPMSGVILGANSFNQKMTPVGVSQGGERGGTYI